MEKITHRREVDEKLQSNLERLQNLDQISKKKFGIEKDNVRQKIRQLLNSTCKIAESCS